MKEKKLDENATEEKLAAPRGLIDILFCPKDNSRKIEKPNKRKSFGDPSNSLHQIEINDWLK